MPGAISQIPEFYTRQFDSTFRMLAQQKDSRLENTVTIEQVTGKEKRIGQIGSMSMQRVTGRAQETRHQDLPMAARWLRPYPYDLPTLEDEWDETLLGTMSSPRSAIMRAHVNAYRRQLDQVTIDAAIGTAYTGEEGVTPVSLPSTQEVDVDYVTSGIPANSGLTLAKLIKAKSILGKNEVDDDEELFFVYSQQQLDDLLNNVNEVKSTDYNAVKALVDGTVNKFMGFTFRKLELLPKDSSDIRTCVAYAKSGVALAPGPKGAHLDILPTRNHALQVRTVAMLGATRLEEKKVVAVYCDESP